jgi:hypothetical protein
MQLDLTEGFTRQLLEEGGTTWVGILPVMMHQAVAWWLILSAFVSTSGVLGMTTFTSPDGRWLSCRKRGDPLSNWMQ